MKAIYKDTVIAESNDTIVVDDNHYFPWDSLNGCFFMKSDHTTECGWKGEAKYLNVVVEDDENKNAAWYYPEPKEKASNIKNHVAFYDSVKVTA